MNVVAGVKPNLVMTLWTTVCCRISIFKTISRRRSAQDAAVIARNRPSGFAPGLRLGRAIRVTGMAHVSSITVTIVHTDGSYPGVC